MENRDRRIAKQEPTIGQFQGKQGRPALMDALRKQALVDGHSSIAERIAANMTLREYYEGEALFRQGERGGELALLLAGKVSIRTDGNEVAVIAAGLHVGEIGMLEPYKGRTATVVALETVVAALLTQRQFEDMAKAFPELWRRLALQLAHRLVRSQHKG